MRITTVRARIDAGAVDTFLAASVANAEASVGSEPGCLRFDVIQDARDPSLIGFYEVYVDDAAVEAHGNAPQFHRWIEATDGMGEMGWGTCANLFPGDDAGWDAGPGPEAALGGGLFVVLREVTAGDGDRARLTDAVVELAATSVEVEAGCLRFDVAQSLEDEASLWLYSVFTDVSAHTDHVGSSHGRSLEANLKGWSVADEASAIRGANVWPPDSWRWSPSVA